jgi:hypothetical protein
MDVLAPELRAALEPSYGASDDVVMSGKKRPRAPKTKAAPPPPQTRAERRASKSKERKLAKLEVRLYYHDLFVLDVDVLM